MQRSEQTGVRLGLTVTVALALVAVALADLGHADVSPRVAGAGGRDGQPSPEDTPTATPPGDLADLTVSAITLDLDPLEPCTVPDRSWGIVVGIGNGGGVGAGAFNVDVSGRRVRVHGLRAGGALRVWLSGLAGADVTAVVDMDNEVPEESEDNNSMSVQLPVPSMPPPCAPSPTPTQGAPPPGLPDLVPDAAYSWSCPCWPCPGHEPTGAACVANVGGRAAGPFQLVVAPRNSPVRLLHDFPGLSLGRQCVDTGSVSVEVVVDSREAVVESDEANNRGSFSAPTYTPPPPCASPSPTSATPYPDLVVVDARSDLIPQSWLTPGHPGCRIPGEPFVSRMDAQVSNQGAAEAGPFVVRVEPAADTFWEVPSLGPGRASWLGVKSVWADVVIVDADEQVVEADEGNNRRVLPPTPVHTAPAPCTVVAPQAHVYLPHLEQRKRP